MASLPEDKTMDFSFSSLVSQQQSSNDPEVEDLAIRQITDFSSTALKGKTLNPGEDFWFEGAEGKKIQGFVVKPAGFKQGEKGKWPAVLLIHGGKHPWFRMYFSAPMSYVYNRPTRRMGRSMEYEVESAGYGVFILLLLLVETDWGCC